jgi:hypothetical protein
MITKHSEFEQGGGAVCGVDGGPELFTRVHSADLGFAF